MTLFIKVLFVLLLCYISSVSVYATGETQIEISADIFKLPMQINDVQTLNEDNGGKMNITIQNIKPPIHFFVAKEGVIVVLAEAEYKNTGSGASLGNNGKMFDIVSRNFKTNSQSKLDKEVFKNVDGKWKTQLATENNEKAKEFSTIIASTLNTDKDKIYVFLLKITGINNDKKWDFKLVEGTANGGKGGGTIAWNKKSLTLLENKNEEIKKEVNKDKQDLSLTDGSVFLIEKKEQVLFVLKGQFTGTGGGAAKRVSIIFFQLKKNQGAENELELLKVENVEGLHSFFQWKDKIFRTPIDLNAGSNEIRVLDAASKSFNKSDDPITRLRDFLKDKNNFATATINGNDDVLLLTQQKSEDSKNNVYLWMSDGTRVVNTGKIITITDTQKTLYGSLLQTDNELVALYQMYETKNDVSTGDNKIYFTTLNSQLKSIKNTLNAWKENYKNIQEHYKELAKTSSFTDGLVGFLSETETGNGWKDKFSYASATVTKNSETKNVTNGFTFSGKNAGAKWLVGKPKEDQAYNFTASGFTLVATVTIHNNEKDKNSVLGIGLEGTNKEKNSIGLWCSGGKWGVTYKRSTVMGTSNAKPCVQQGKYEVALILDKTTFSVYIGNQKFGDVPDSSIAMEKPLNITHFYFGVETGGANENTDESHVTVTNVLLYNRPFNDSEIGTLKEDVKIPQIIETSDNNKNIGTQGGEQIPPPQPQSTDERKDEKSPSPSRTEDGGVGGGVRVFFLLLTVLCVSAPLLRL